MPRALLRDLNAALSCMLCGGYLVNAATLVDCLHSFCKVCIVRYLDTSKLCPICDVPVHKSRPLSCLRVDKTLQDIVYKVVPGLYQREMKQRREFYDQHPDAAFKVPCLEDRGVVDVSSRLIFSPQDTVSYKRHPRRQHCGGRRQHRCRRYRNDPAGFFDFCSPRTISKAGQTGHTANAARESEDDGKEDAADGEGKRDPRRGQRRFLSCPAAFTISHMQKFLCTKYALAPSLKIDILHMGDVLSEGYSLMDVAYIYAWKRESPLRLAFRVYSQPTKRPAPADTAEGLADVDGRRISGNPVGQQQQCSPEQATVPVGPVPPESSAVASVEEGVAQSVGSPETDAEPPALVPRDVLSAEEASDAAVLTAVPAAETRQPDTLDGTTATKRSAAPGSAQAADVVRSSSPLQQQRQKAAEPPAVSPPALSKITISTLDRSSNKITIQTKEVPPAVAQAMSPPRSPQSRKSRRKEQRDAERPLQHARHQGRPPDSQDAQRPRHGATPAKNARLNGANVAEVEAAHGHSASRPASPGRRLPESASLPEPARRARVPPGMGCSTARHAGPSTSRWSHRGLAGAGRPWHGPVGRPPLALPPACPPGSAKRPASPSPHRRAAASSPVVSLYQKPAVAVNQAATSSPLPQQHHHHHNHHRSSSRGFLKGANLTCINPTRTPFTRASSSRTCLRALPAPTFTGCEAASPCRPFLDEPRL
ncbi:hypothetical protein HPB47_011222 [Ixodes persulcatus]|uniref:Uncharacterized protein n=1 Tax=Ixodes persulcatus TaxID=34615 RepID=A0AC60NWW6_IXOPE|nr:hypothetical protein HPB47_011222 [Ixodes persulcatus]